MKETTLADGTKLRLNSDKSISVTDAFGNTEKLQEGTHFYCFYAQILEIKGYCK